MPVIEQLKALIAIIFGLVIVIAMAPSLVKVLVESFGTQSLDLGFFKLPLAWLVIPFFIIAIIVAIVGWFFKSLKQEVGVNITSLSLEKKQKDVREIARSYLKSEGIHEIAGSPPELYKLPEGDWRVIFRNTDPKGDWFVDIDSKGNVIRSGPYKNIK
jgi:hypothetical protein